MLPTHSYNRQTRRLINDNDRRLKLST